MEMEIVNNNNQENDVEEQRIINAIINIENKDIKKIKVEGKNINQRQNKIMFFAYSNKCSLYIFDENTNQMLPTINIDTERSYSAPVTLPNGNIILFGGHYRLTGVFMSSYAILNTRTFQITDNIGNMNEVRGSCAAILLRSGLILIVGGRSGYKKYSNTCELYDPSTNTITLSNARMREKRDRHTVSMLPNGEIMVCGGWNGETKLRSTEIYNPESDSFRDGPEMHYPRFSHNATEILNGDILISGGETHYETYDHITNSFKYPSDIFIYANGNDVDDNMFATILSNGKVWMGDARFTHYESRNMATRIYDPKTETFSEGLAIKRSERYHSHFHTNVLF